MHAAEDHAAEDGPIDRSTTTRIIHLLLLLLVLHQLVGNQFMERPLPGEDPSTVYLLHEYVGLAGLAVMVAFWAWTLVRHGETQLGRLVPWFSVRRLRDLWADTAAQLGRLARLRAPSDADGAMASAVHGLGLLVLSIMTATGTVFFVFAGTALSHDAMTIHKLFANLMWAYLIAHAGLAVLHHLLGSDIFSRMFLRARREQVDAPVA